MRNLNLSERIKELRTQLGYSQNELADNARLSLRTVQRIENGEAKPRGFTLQSLAGALNITPAELTVWEEKSDKLFLVIFNLSALSFLMFPFLGVFVPLILWAMKKNKVKNVGDMGRNLLNFQITWCILLIVGYLCLIANAHWGGAGAKEIFYFLFFAGILYLINFVSIVINAIRVLYEKPGRYFMAVRFLK
ncbi:helix-turn-helix domain-containing protein [Mucilaginibacter sp.]|uniref:helix-turn-helix domain-containing protein n=1 Tax=Mucilaginibacter sp. TaxID=1882438 RepID=UPI00262D5A5E|nr:helix-turn-helix domain-containing protein [Mucilaginibacter sp.]MDB5030037.1 DNA-binding protein [Mucilaginibacter sp.]